MDHASCNVVYIDSRASDDRVVTKGGGNWPPSPTSSSPLTNTAADTEPRNSEVVFNVNTLLGSFNEGMCSSELLLSPSHRLPLIARDTQSVCAQEAKLVSHDSHK